MIWQKTNGTRFVLNEHEPGEWGEKLATRLVALGLPAEKAEAVAAGYREAVRV
jgi:hypothetical protein